MTFDHARAWQELARPAVDCLPENLRALLERVKVEAADLCQDEDLDTVWPETDLRSCFEKVPSEELARAARAVYFFGHWRPYPWPEGAEPRTGSHWKFSSYVDQVLRAPLGLVRARTLRAPSKRGDALVTYAVHEGILRIQASNDGPGGFWTWREFGLATPTTFDRATAILPHGKVVREDSYEAALPKLKELRPRGGYVEKFFDLSEYGGQS
jgi:hypothetical protein